MPRRGPAAPNLTPTPAQLEAFGLDPAWSRRVSVTDASGRHVDWHVLDTGGGERGTVVCVHGNPSWAYLWRDVLGALAPTWRVVAVDQTNMGYSERTSPRRLSERVDELVGFCREHVAGPLVLVAHDWGGAVAVGASAHLDVAALVLANTAVAKPDGVRVPPLIALARRATSLVCRDTPTFVAGAAAMTARRHRTALLAPYRTRARRAGVAQFVADIPVSPGDASYEALARGADALAAFRGPTLLLWGGRDPVFNDRFLRDLRDRAPDAAVQRYARAGHYVPLDEPVGTVIRDWLEAIGTRHPATSDALDADATALEILDAHRDDASSLYVGPEGSLTWRDLSARSGIAAGALEDAGIAPRDRVSLLVPPGPELLVAAMAVWRAGGVPVVADASGGLVQLRRLVRAAAPRVVIGTTRTLAAATALGIAPRARRAGFCAAPGVVDLRASGDGARAAVRRPGPGDVAAIVHTSGSTGPAKPVRYTHAALAALRPALQSLGLRPKSAFVTSFGPFLLLAPVLDMTCVRPDFDVMKPSELGFDELAAAIAATPVSAAWLSPAAARRIVSTASGRKVELDLVMLAGAPITPSLAAAVGEVTGADVRTPYGMTECLPVTDGADPAAVGALGGASTGRAVEGCRVRVMDLTDPTRALGDGGGWGELAVHAPWMFDGYDGAWGESHRAELWVDGVRFHRTGDVGYLEGGRLFHLGRLGHVIWAAQGPLASVAIEGPIAERLGRDVAAVGVGPRGAQVLCVVVDEATPLSLADEPTRALVRSASPHRVAAVLTARLPLDHRHQSKVDRSTLARDVASLLAGR